METDKNYFLVGLFVIGMIAAGLAFSLWLTSGGRGGYDTYQIHFADSVSGLREQSEVRFHGVRVGTVEKIAIDPNNPASIRVNIQVAKHTPVRSDTTAALNLAGITGDVYIDLSGGDPRAPQLASTTTPPEIPGAKNTLNEMANDIPDIAHRTDQLIEKLNHIADQLNKIFSDQNVKSVNSAVKGISKTFGSSDDN